MNDEQLDKLEQLKAQSDAGGGRDKATTSNFVLYNLYRTAVMDAAPELLAAARENAALRRELQDERRAAEVCRVKAHGWRNEANTIEPETEEWKQLIAKAEAGEELSRFLVAALKEQTNG